MRTRTRVVFIWRSAKPSAAAQPDVCACCIAAREIGWSALLFGAGCLLLLLVNRIPEGARIFDSLGIHDIRPILRWPIFIWMALAVFALLTQATKCLKLPAEKLLDLLKGKKPPDAPLAGGGEALKLPPLSSGLPVGQFVPAAAAAAVAVAVTVHIQPTVDPVGTTSVPIGLKVEAAKGQPPLPLPVTLAASGGLSVPVSFALAASEVRQKVSIEPIVRTELILKPDADVKLLVDKLASTASAVATVSTARQAELEALVQSAQALRDASSAMLSWSTRTDQNLQAYGKGLHELVAQMAGTKLDIGFLRQAVLAPVQPQFPDRWPACDDKFALSRGSARENAQLREECERVHKVFERWNLLQAGNGATPQRITQSEDREVKR